MCASGMCAGTFGIRAIKCIIYAASIDAHIDDFVGLGAQELRVQTLGLAWVCSLERMA